MDHLNINGKNKHYWETHKTSGIQVEYFHDFRIEKYFLEHKHINHRRKEIIN